jgi:hypothetical protein
MMGLRSGPGTLIHIALNSKLLYKETAKHSGNRSEVSECTVIDAMQHEVVLVFDARDDERTRPVQAPSKFASCRESFPTLCSTSSMCKKFPADREKSTEIRLFQ